MKDKLLTVTEVAEILRVPRSWIYSRIHKRNLPFESYKVGRYVRIPEGAVAEYLEGCRIEPTARL